MKKTIKNKKETEKYNRDYEFKLLTVGITGTILFLITIGYAIYEAIKIYI